MRTVLVAVRGSKGARSNIAAQPGHHDGEFVPQDLRVRRQLVARRRADEQLVLAGDAEAGEGAAHRRLGQVSARRRSRDVPFVQEHFQRLQQVEVDSVDMHRAHGSCFPECIGQLATGGSV